MIPEISIVTGSQFGSSFWSVDINSKLTAGCKTLASSEGDEHHPI